jgi:hypothetical protein
MLHLIVTGRAAELGRFRATSFSVVAHAGLALALIAPRPSRDAHAPRGIMRAPSLERVHFMVAPPPRAEDRPTGAVKARRSAARPVVRGPAPPALSLTIPTDVANATPVDDLDLTGAITDSLDFKPPPRTLAEAIGAALVNRRATAPPANGVYTADGVDRVVSPLSGNPKPVYPRSLESQGVEADFTVMFVVDSTGRVDAGSLEVPRDVHRLFADAVRYALSRSRYLPATIAGRPVRQLVAQEFIFRMR